MHARSFLMSYAVFWIAMVGQIAFAAEPRVTSDAYKLELIASDPQIVTPVGMAFNKQGRLLVIESHTHQRADDYKGLPSDRVRMLSDSDGDGKLDKWSTFAEGFRHAMNLLVRDDGAVYLVTRRNVVLLRDTDGDGVADKQEEVLKLETKSDYPHNALSGIARDIDGSLIIGMGENQGEGYELIGADGTTIKDGGGQDGFYRMSADGKGLKWFARGVWNPFSVCVLPDGRIFAVDNDPDSSPPCRLLHVVPGGDYGYLYQYGRAGTHPLQCWNGELPGTLPMACGVGEAPTAIVPHAGGLWVTSWGDHRIERYELEPRGASYGAKREIVVQGGIDFRPTGMAVAPDGSLYFADWVLRDYPVHGRGKIWRLILPKEQIRRSFPPRSAEDLTAQTEPTAMSSDPFVQAQASWRNVQSEDIEQIATASARNARITIPIRMRMNVLQTLRWHGPSDAEAVLRANLQDKAIDVRLLAIRWIADERIMALRDDVAKLLEGPQANPQLYLAALAAVDWLDHEPTHRKADFTDELLVRELSNNDRTPEAHAFALAYLDPDNKFLTLDRLREYLNSKSEPLRMEAVRTLVQQSNENRFELLVTVAQDESQPDDVRAEAVAGLAAAAEKQRAILEKLATSDHEVVHHEAERALRLAGIHPPPNEQKPPADDQTTWNQILATPGDAAAGRRLFFSSVGPKCSICHKYSGRGGNVGPELTHIGRDTPRERIIASILQPGREVAPDYQSWTLTTADGKSHTALRVPKPGDDGTEDYVDSAGHRFTLKTSEIEDRRAAATSIMPDNLQSMISIDDLRDLVTFLATQSSKEKAPGH